MTPCPTMPSRSRTSYPERLGIPLTGNDETVFRCRNGVLLAAGYVRIVIGGRGPYVEFTDRNIDLSIHFRKTDVPHRYYTEYRSTPSEVKLYHQHEVVDYADYRPGLYYISPFDMMVDGKRIITELRPPRVTTIV